MTINNKGYRWLVTNEIMGFSTFTKFTPWYLLKEEDLIYINHPALGNLVIFARRQDCDDAACIVLSDRGSNDKVYLIEFLSIVKIEVVENYKNIWEWFASIISDIEEVVENEEKLP